MSDNLHNRIARAAVYYMQCSQSGVCRRRKRPTTIGGAIGPYIGFVICPRCSWRTICPTDMARVQVTLPCSVRTPTNLGYITYLCATRHFMDKCTPPMSPVTG